jgi:ribose/xylose/arabinose/galactoside ABC-type transport system permease subunit
LLFHLIWEAFLLVAVIAVVALGTLTIHPFRYDWYSFILVILVAGALALSLRASTANLAVTAIAGLAGLYTAKLVNGSTCDLGLRATPARLQQCAAQSSGLNIIVAGAIVVLVALVVGAGCGLLIAVTRLPSWAASLAVAIGAITIGQVINRPGLPVVLHGASVLSRGWLTVWALVLAAGLVAGAALLAVPVISRLVVPAASATGRTGVPVGSAIVGFGGSCAIAALAGVVNARVEGLATTPSMQFSNLFLVFGVVLLGGVSVLGGRAGIFGTVFAAALIAGLYPVLSPHVASWVLVGLLPTLMIVVGLVVSGVLRMLAHRDN